MEHLLTAFPSRLIILAICSVLFWLGGFSFLPARRFIMPIILSLFACLISHSFYGLISLTACGVFCLGYGEKSPLRHIFGNGWGRGIWGLLGACGLSVGLFCSDHISLIFFLPYLILNFTLENALKDIPQIIGDPLIGAGFASIVFLIH